MVANIAIQYYNTLFCQSIALPIYRIALCKFVPHGHSWINNLYLFVYIAFLMAIQWHLLLKIITCSCTHILSMFKLLVSPHIMCGRELSTLVVILWVCHNGKSLWGHQTWTSHALQPLVILASSLYVGMPWIFQDGYWGWLSIIIIMYK